MPVARCSRSKRAGCRRSAAAAATDPSFRAALADGAHGAEVRATAQRSHGTLDSLGAAGAIGALARPGEPPATTTAPTVLDAGDADRRTRFRRLARRAGERPRERRGAARRAPSQPGGDRAGVDPHRGRRQRGTGRLRRRSGGDAPGDRTRPARARERAARRRPDAHRRRRLAARRKAAATTSATPPRGRHGESTRSDARRRPPPPAAARGASPSAESTSTREQAPGRLAEKSLAYRRFARRAGFHNFPEHRSAAQSRARSGVGCQGLKELRCLQ